MADAQFLTDTRSSVIETNKVLRNTYMLLSMTLAFSALTAGLSMAFNWPHPGLILTLVGYFGFLFATMKFRDSGIGILCVFGLTGFMGLTMGPIISMYLSLSNGAEIVAYAFGTTAVAFLGLSGYAIASKKDFSFLGPMLRYPGSFLRRDRVVLPEHSRFVTGSIFHVRVVMAGMMLYQTVKS